MLPCHLSHRRYVVVGQVVQRRAEGATCNISGVVTGVVGKGMRSRYILYGLNS